MAQSDELIKGVAIGIGAALLIPVAVTALAPIVRPVARSAFKAGLTAYEKARETLEELSEEVEDMVAEVEEELVDARTQGNSEEGIKGEVVDGPSP